MKVAESVKFDELFKHCKLPITKLLSKRQQTILLSSVNIVQYNKKDVIVKQNSISSHVFYIIEGVIKVTREQRKGKNIVLKIDTRGSFVGLISLLGGNRFNFTLTAVENTIVAQIPIATISLLMEENSKFSLEISQHISRHSIFLINRLTGLLYKQLPGRVADLILYFSEEIYQNYEFAFPVNRVELAELCGTTKESLIRTLSEFNHDKIIELNRNNIKILSYDILKTLSKLG